jgi:hypothetical protein
MEARGEERDLERMAWPGAACDDPAEGEYVSVWKVVSMLRCDRPTKMVELSTERMVKLPTA